MAIAIIAAFLPSLTTSSAAPQREAAPTYGSREEINAQFSRRLSSGAEIYSSTDANYTQEVTQRWQTRYAPTYRAAIKPATAKDVQTIVQIASKHNIPFLATGGGHGLSSTLARLRNGIEIDMNGFNGIEVDKASKTAVIGGGARYGDVIEPLYKAGLQIPIGSCDCVGFMGGAVGGGVGRYQGLQGIGADNWISAQVVTGTGELLEISETKNRDLFWGFKGAGANLGIVVSGKFKASSLVNGGKALNADFAFPASSNRTHWKIMKDIIAADRPNFAVQTQVRYNETFGGPFIVVTALYEGPEAEGRKAIEPLTKNNPLRSNITIVPWNLANNVSAFGGFVGPACEKGTKVNTYSVGTQRIDTATLEKQFANMTQVYKEQPKARIETAVYLEQWPIQALLAAPANSTSFHDRRTSTRIYWHFHYDDPSLETYFNQKGRDFRAAVHETSGFDRLQVYANYAHGDEGAATWYGPENLGPLRNLKRRWDPKQRFSFFNPIPI
ncbi:MAG: hypothetical protein M1831_001779 [Alyxoria varia]|nr:MAG: hypothetical protein M1831_001779 [Alyxoria varia]